MKKRCITILYYTNGTITQYLIPHDREIDSEKIEESLINKGYSLSNIEWMLHEDETVNRYIWT